MEISTWGHNIKYQSKQYFVILYLEVSVCCIRDYPCIFSVCACSPSHLNYFNLKLNYTLCPGEHWYKHAGLWPASFVVNFYNHPAFNGI